MMVHTLHMKTWLHNTCTHMKMHWHMHVCKDIYTNKLHRSPRNSACPLYSPLYKKLWCSPLLNQFKILILMSVSNTILTQKWTKARQNKRTECFFLTGETIFCKRNQHSVCRWLKHEHRMYSFLASFSLSQSWSDGFGLRDKPGKHCLCANLHVCSTLTKGFFAMAGICAYPYTQLQVK